MSPGADLWEDGFPHGTPEGFQNGCRGGSCPGLLDYGMSCKTAEIKSHSDYRYKGWLKAGKTPREIAELLELIPPSTHAEETPTMAPAPFPTPPRKPRPAKPVPDEPDHTDGEYEGPPPAAEPLAADLDPFGDDEGVEYPDAAQPLAESSQDRMPASVAADEPSESPAPAELNEAGIREEMGHPQFETFVPLTGRAHRAKTAAIRSWCRSNGFPGLGNRGLIPQDALAAYDATHPTHVDPSPEPPSETPETWTPELDAHPEAIAKGDTLVVVSDDTTTTLTVVDVDDTAEDGVTRITGAQLVGAEFSEAIDQARDRAGIVDPPDRPEWSEVTISEDVEAARNLAVRLEGELAKVEQERDAAQRAMSIAITQWGAARTEVEALRGEVTMLEDLLRVVRNSTWAIGEMRRVAASKHRRRIRSGR